MGAARVRKAKGKQSALRGSVTVEYIEGPGDPARHAAGERFWVSFVADVLRSIDMEPPNGCPEIQPHDKASR